MYNKIDLTEHRDFSQKIRYPILYRTPWRSFSESSTVPWQRTFTLTCERCGLRLNEELPWRRGYGELCYDCDIYLETFVIDQSESMSITNSVTHADQYDLVFLAEYGT